MAVWLESSTNTLCKSYVGATLYFNNILLKVYKVNDLLIVDLFYNDLHSLKLIVYHFDDIPFQTVSCPVSPFKGKFVLIISSLYWCCFTVFSHISCSTDFIITLNFVLNFQSTRQRNQKWQDQSKGKGTV